LFILSCLVLANDGFGALGAGGIIIGKTDDIAMVKEVLDIGYDKIKVDYEFVNESDHDITEIIVFPMPPYLVGDQDPYPSYMGVIPNFNIIVNGKPIKFQTKVRAVAWDKKDKEADITQKLRNIGFSDYAIIMSDYNRQQILYQNKDLLIKNGLLDPQTDTEYGFEPLWKNYIDYEWKQTFKAHQKLKISHSYTPLTSNGTSGCYEESLKNGFQKAYCMNSKIADLLGSLAKDERNWGGYPCLPGFNVDYILKTANTWKDGIRDFKLIVRKRKADEIISLCFPGDFKKISSLTYEMELKNFKPKQDLSIYFGNVDKNAPFQPKAKPPIFQ
jgi:hypothetical protein